MSELEQAEETAGGWWNAAKGYASGVGTAMHGIDLLGHAAGAVPALGLAADGARTVMGAEDIWSAYQKGGVHSDELWDGVGMVANAGGSAALEGAAFAAPETLCAAGAGIGGLFGGPLGMIVGGELGLEGGEAAAVALEATNMAFSGYQVATDLVGGAAGLAFGADAGFDADKVTGGMIRGMAGDESIGWGAGAAVDDALGGGGLGMAAGVATSAITNVALSPLNLFDTVVGGAVNWVDEATDGNTTTEDEDQWSMVKDEMWNFAM